MHHFKTDFHLHTRDDRNDLIEHTAQELFALAAQKGFRALAITNHDTFTYSLTLQRAAADLGILLIPGIERQIERKHVLLLNAFPATEKINTFDDLRRAKEDGLFVIAPHPFFRLSMCLEDKLLEHLELFDAVEYSFFYSRWINFNRKAVRLTRSHNLPLVGNSDCHMLNYFGVCHSVIDAAGLDMESIFQAIRNKQVEVVSKPLSFLGLCRYPADGWLTKRRLRRAGNQPGVAGADGQAVVLSPANSEVDRTEVVAPPARAAEGGRS